MSIRAALIVAKFKEGLGEDTKRNSYLWSGRQALSQGGRNGEGTPGKADLQ